MYKVEIRKQPIEQADRLYLGQKLWGSDDYNHEVYAQLAYNDSGFVVKFTVSESNPLCEKEHHFEQVCQDSCVEFFVNFLPERSEHYINFEMNAKGVVNAAFRTDRYDSIRLTMEDVASLQVKADIFDGYWTLEYKISYDLLRKYYFDFSEKEMSYIVGNLYKCGEKTEVEHYLSLFKVDTETPDFHRPEYFQRINILTSGI